MRVLISAIALALMGCHGKPAAAEPAPLVLERTIPLAGVKGRIDHLAMDSEAHRLFVAELGDGGVEALDLATGKSLGRIGGLDEPQGVGYLPGRDELVVATGGDGMARFYRAADLSLVATLKLGDDADDVRIEATGGRVAIGYGHALALIDPHARRVVGTVPLPAHPEGFEIRGDRGFVNLPAAGAVAALDLAQGHEIARWPNPGPRFNFPLALDRAGHTLVVVYRLPASLAVIEAATGRTEQQLETCGDADDVFFDRDQTRLYVTCGSGAVDVFDRRGRAFAHSGRVPTRSGARTGLYSEKLDRLFVAARAQGGQPAAILVFRPAA